MMAKPVKKTIKIELVGKKYKQCELIDFKFNMGTKETEPTFYSTLDFILTFNGDGEVLQW